MLFCRRSSYLVPVGGVASFGEGRVNEAGPLEMFILCVLASGAAGVRLAY